LTAPAGRRILEGKGRARRQTPEWETDVARRTLLAVVAVLVGTTACGDAAEHREPRSLPQGPRGLFTVADRLHGVPGKDAVRLAAAPVTPLAGWMTPAASPSPDGRFVAYSTWRRLRADDPLRSWADQGIGDGDALAIPSVRVHDLATGGDALVAEGAYGAVWRADGALAYARGRDTAYRAYRPYETHVVVRKSIEEPEQTWSAEPGRYVPVAWAGDRLVAYRLSEGEHVDTLVLAEPGVERMLVPGGTVVAVSPDGAEAFVEDGAAAGRPRVRIVDVATGETRAAARMDIPVGYGGDWRSDLVVASAGRELRVFRIRDGRIGLERRIALGAFPTEPRFADPEGRRIVASADGHFVECARLAGSCVEHRPGARSEWHRLVYDPSRPR
jgi:hypothetical protein